MLVAQNDKKDILVALFFWGVVVNFKPQTYRVKYILLYYQMLSNVLKLLDRAVDKFLGVFLVLYRETAVICVNNVIK